MNKVELNKDMRLSPHFTIGELILEQRGTTYWVHFAVRPNDRSATKGDACQS